MIGRRIEQEETAPVHPVIFAFLLLGGVALVWGVFKMAGKEAKK